MRSIDRDERRAILGSRHLLETRAANPSDVARALVGVHSSDPASVYLSLRARLGGAGIADIEHALYGERSLVRVLGMRRTMFVTTPALADVVDSACTRALAPAERRRLVGLLETQGFAADAAKWLARVEADTVTAIRARGEATARDLRNDVPELRRTVVYGEGKKWGGEFGLSTRVLFLLAAEGRIVRARPLGSWISSQYRWAVTEDWLGVSLGNLETAAAEEVLLRLWLEQYGPGTLTDIAWWTGWGKRKTQATLDRIGARPVRLEGGGGYIAAGASATADPPRPWVALLPGLDSTVMGWKERDWYLGTHEGALFDRNGNAGPTVWTDGRIVGGWAQREDGTVVVSLLEPVPSDIEDRIHTEAKKLEAWFEGVVVTPRFRTPLEQALRAATA